VKNPPHTVCTVQNDTPRDRVRALRAALGLSQERLAAATGGELVRDDIVKLEKGQNQGTSSRVRRGLAIAAGVDLVVMDQYMDGKIELEELMASRATRPVEPTRPILRQHPRWSELYQEARRIFPEVPQEYVDAIGSQPFVWGEPGDVDARLVGELAERLWSWHRRKGKRVDEATPSSTKGSGRR